MKDTAANNVLLQWPIDTDTWQWSDQPALHAQFGVSPEMLLELMDELGVEAARTLMVGDTTHDLLMARNAGVAAVAVSFGAHTRDVLEAAAPLTVCDSVGALGEWLRHQG